MRSYYSHLEAVNSTGEAVSSKRKPTFRSSAIFPVLHNERYSTKVIFMGYWLLKRHIREIGLLYTLRSEMGEIISRKYLLIQSAKAFSIQLSEFDEIKEREFTGSLELEIFSTQDLVYPYPAFVLVYYGENFSTMVHTAGRIYNDIEDLSKNEEYRVRESGFDIYGNQNFEPFIAFTNGPLANEKPTINYEIDSANALVLKGNFQLAPIAPFQTIFLKLKEHIKLDEVLGNAIGSIKLDHNFEGFFPRFIAGNIEKESQSISITHTYYDSSKLSDDKSYWNRKDELFNDSSVAIPLYVKDGFFTRLALYPIFSPSDFSLSLSFYDEDGNLLDSINDYHVVKSENGIYEQIDFGSIIEENPNLKNAKTVNLICNWMDKTHIPTRVKFGLNVGKENDNNALPCNICFAPQLGNPDVLKKAGTFRWAPLANIGSSAIALTNSSSLKKYEHAAHVKISFHREQDDNVLLREISIAANALHEIKIESDEELEKFLNQRSGRMAAQSDNPFLNGYYFDFFESGAVGADHNF